MQREETKISGNKTTLTLEEKNKCDVFSAIQMYMLLELNRTYLGTKHSVDVRL